MIQRKAANPQTYEAVVMKSLVFMPDHISK